MANPFKDLIARLKRLEFPSNDEGSEKVRIAKGVSLFSISRWEKHLGGKLPADLRLLLHVTRAFQGIDVSHGSATINLDLDDGGLEPARELGFGELYKIDDYGNGDGLYLEPGAVESRLWWLGHDPWFLMLVDVSLIDYVERCVEFLESCAARQASEDEEDEDEAPTPPYEPRSELESSSPTEILETLDEQSPESLRSFLQQLPANAWVYDLRDVDLLPVEPTIPDLRRLVMADGWVQRHGAVVALVPDLVAQRPPEDPVEPFISRALAFESIGLSDQADAELQKGLAASPANPRVLSWIAELEKRRRT